MISWNRWIALLDVQLIYIEVQPLDLEVQPLDRDIQPLDLDVQPLDLDVQSLDLDALDLDDHIQDLDNHILDLDVHILDLDIHVLDRPLVHRESIFPVHLVDQTFTVDLVQDLVKGKVVELKGSMFPGVVGAIPGNIVGLPLTRNVIMIVHIPILGTKIQINLKEVAPGIPPENVKVSVHHLMMTVSSTMENFTGNLIKENISMWRVKLPELCGTGTLFQ